MLPRDFKPKGTFDLVRLGGNHDGGYLIDKKTLQLSKCLISFGIGTNFEFEKDFYKLGNKKIYCYDFSIYPNFIKNIVIYFFSGLINFRNLKKLIYFLKIFLNFITFINMKNVFFFSKKVQSKLTNKNSIILRKIMSNVVNFPVLLKVDIEGDEYDILSDIKKMSHNIQGLIIEFHGINSNLKRKRIVDFIKDNPLKIIHFHANNYTGKDKLGDPTTIEISFSKNPLIINKKVRLPHFLDMKNSPKKPEINIVFDR
jgi:hypothetical protein